MTNRLAQETSPYLLQHADNPVEWYPWGEEALNKAVAEDKPILLSIGYAACHWCHVMAHESFEDEDTAALMNRYFVNIKVDREERPDLDSIYMNAVQALTGQGGWPMTVFLTPEGKPFYGGTYFPPVPRFGMPSFPQLLTSVAEAWETRRGEIENSATGITGHLSQAARLGGQEGRLSPALFDQALSTILGKFDSQEGGFGQAPKFPPSMTLEFLLRMASGRQDGMALHMAEHTLTKMAHGGMYDQLGGGFARYSTDKRWLVPHFEKMLYDNALLSRVYLHAYQLTGEPLYRRIVQETLEFVRRELTHSQGGFYSSFDADSEGEEGRFYVWEAAEIEEVLGAEAPLFMRAFDVSEEGNWEGHNILNVSDDPHAVATEFGLELSELAERLGRARQRLYEVRARRVWPGLDEKVLASWNGLMLAAFAEAGRFLQHDEYLQIARRNAEFLYRNLRRADGRLLRTWKAGASARYDGYLEDYAYLADGLLALYEATHEPRWFAWSLELAGLMLTYFSDEANGGFFDTAADHETLLYRPKDLQDNAIPSANAMAAHVFLKLSLFTGEGHWADVAERAIRGMVDLMGRFPTGFAHWLCAADLVLGDPKEVAIAGDPERADARALIDVVNAAYRPNLVLAVGNETGGVPLLAGRAQRNGASTAYVCRRFVCQTPVTTPEALAEQLNGERV